MMRTSLKCVPPRYGSLTANTSPGWMSSANASITALQVKCSVPTWTAMSCDPCMIVSPFDVAERRGEVAGVDDERVAGAQDLLRHLVDGGREGVLQHLERDGVERVAARRRCSSRRLRSCMRMFSHSSTSASSRAGRAWSSRAGRSRPGPRTRRRRAGRRAGRPACRDGRRPRRTGRRARVGAGSVGRRRLVPGELGLRRDADRRQLSW